MHNIGKSGEFAKDWGRREWDGKNRENIFVILPNIQVFSIFAYLVVHTGTGTAHKRTEPVFFMGCPPDRHPQPDNARLSVKRQQTEQSIPHT